MSCPDCDGVARREFLKTAALGSVGISAYVKNPVSRHHFTYSIIPRVSGVLGQ